MLKYINAAMPLETAQILQEDSPGKKNTNLYKIFIRQNQFLNCINIGLRRWHRFIPSYPIYQAATFMRAEKKHTNWSLLDVIIVVFAWMIVFALIYIVAVKIKLIINHQ